MSAPSLRQEAASCVVRARQDGGTFEALLRFPADLSVFAGHFPGHPVLPGVYLLEAAAHAAARALARPLELCAVLQAKLSAELPPGAEVLLRGDLREGPEGAELEAQALLGARVAASFRLELRRPPCAAGARGVARA